jgi:hypothetical protein
MIRLRDQITEGDPAKARASELVRAYTPAEPSAARKRRVRAALAHSRRGRSRLPRKVAWVLVLMGGAAMARSVVVPWVRQRLAAQSAQVPDPIAAGAVAPVTRSAPAPVPQAPATVLPAPAPAVTPVVPARPRHASARSPSVAIAAEPAPEPASAAEPTVDSSGYDPALLHNAMRLLRREHDPAQAGELLERYLREHPDGALHEEALGLAIEAAATRGDVRAADLAARYLSRYPEGRFAAAARRARARFTP